MRWVTIFCSYDIHQQETVTNGSKGHRLKRRNGFKVIKNKNPLAGGDENYRTRPKCPKFLNC